MLGKVFVSTGSHNDLSEMFPACIAEGKTNGAFDVLYIALNNLEIEKQSFFFSRLMRFASYLDT